MRARRKMVNLWSTMGCAACVGLRSDAVVVSGVGFDVAAMVA
jgi:hypothetical protein